MQDMDSSLDSLLLGEKAPRNDTWMRALMTSVVQATRASNEVPSGSDFEYFQSTDSGFREEAADIQADIQCLLQRIATFVDDEDEDGGSSSGSGSNGLNGDECEYADLQILVEGLLENADLRLDEMKAMRSKGKSKGQQQQGLQSTRSSVNELETIESLPKPQDHFFVAVDNSRNTPFRPMINKKPHAHARAPLDLRELPIPVTLISMDEEEDTSGLKYGLGEGEGPSSYYAHPYEYELKSLRYTAGQMSDASTLIAANNSTIAMQEISRLSNDHNHPYEFIDTPALLESAIDEMGSYTELAVDLEHHSVHSFQGLTCLLQISTRAKDYIIDTIALRFHEKNQLQALNELFCDPTIVKVFHGCSRDILWLQCDCGVYVVNCFDTYQAAVELELQGLSLAFLLKSYCHVTAQKQYQQADWRQRPLKKELIKYARDDTHYLLFIYDCLRRDVWSKLGKDGYQAVLDRSRETCLSRYEKPRFFPLGYRALIKRGMRGSGLSTLSVTKEAALSALWAFRDEQARITDESPTYIISNTDIVKIALAAPMTCTAFRSIFQNTQHLNKILRYENDIVSLMNAELAVTAGLKIEAPVPATSTEVDAVMRKNTTKWTTRSVTPDSVFTFQPIIAKDTECSTTINRKAIFNQMAISQTSAGWFGHPYLESRNKSVVDKNISTKRNGVSVNEHKSHELMELAQKAIVGRMQVKVNQYKISDEADQGKIVTSINSKQEDLSGYVSILSAQEHADVEAMPAIVVEDVEDEGRKRNFSEMEVPLESHAQAKLVNLKKVKKSGSSKEERRYMQTTASVSVKQTSNGASIRNDANNEAEEFISKIDYSNVSKESLSALNAAGVQNHGMKPKQPRGEKEKEKKKKEKEMRKAFEQGLNAPGSNSMQNPYFANPNNEMSKEKVPERDHNRVYTFK